MNNSLGTSVSFPTKINNSGNANYVSELDNVKQSVEQILNTPLGSEFYQRERGSLIHTLQFEPNDNILRGLLVLFILDALESQEPRIEVFENDIVTSVTINRAVANVFCRIKNSNQTFIVTTTLNRN
jgi:phage baseplate assembly protein W